MDRALRIHREEKTGYRKWTAMRYYDYPDGEDLWGKLSYTTKYAGLAGFTCGFFYTKYPPPAITQMAKLLRVAQVLLPSIGMAVTFTCVTYYCTNFRKKDDQLNYVLGGAAAGAMMGPITGSTPAGVLTAISFAAVGFAKKSAQMKHKTLIPKIKQREFSSYFKKHWNTTLLEDNIRGNWVKELPEEEEELEE